MKEESESIQRVTPVESFYCPSAEGEQEAPMSVAQTLSVGTK
jgi:hypothetical protein